MTLAERPGFGRVAALAILAALIGLFCVGPLATYGSLISDNNDALEARAAVLQRYRVLAAAHRARPRPPARRCSIPTCRNRRPRPCCRRR
jgi:hypothetical protein